MSSREKDTRPARKRRPIRTAIRAILLCVVAALLFFIVGGYAPFAHPPRLSPDAAAVIEARADEMSRDIDTQDRVEILETRTQALDERIRLINQARRELVITTYDCRDGESTRDVLCAALAQAEKGVRVRMLVDGIAGRLYLAGNSVFRAMEAHENVEIRLYNPPSLTQPWRNMGRMHDKYVIADDTAYILGGRNMFDHFIGEYPSSSYSRDREALVYTGGAADSSLHQVLDYFEGMWAHERTAPFPGKPMGAEEAEAVYTELRSRREALMQAKPELFESADYPAMTLPTRGIWLISNPTNTDAKEPTAFNALCALMEHARSEITIHSPYCVLNDMMQKRLTAIAERVPVTLMVNAVENGANVVASGDYLYHKAQVLSTGMHVLEYAGGDSYHGKALSIDDNISVIGSYNLDLRSTFVDTELMLVIRGREVNALLRGHMDALHADCRRVIDEQHGEVPDGLVIPAPPLWKAAAMRVVGAVMQLVRNLV